MSSRAFTTTTRLPLDEAESVVRAALAEQGFGVLTEIDIAATLKTKLGVDRAPLKILGACNPGFANRALDAEPDIALLLPCNVVVEERDGATRVSAVDPRTMLDDPALADLADEAAALLEAAIAAVPTA